MLSVIVPVYKAEKYIHECVDSLIAAKTENFEIILVNDGSPDKCGKICDEYAEKYDYIKAIHQENAGVVCARRRGIREATGDYVTFVDSDDSIKPDMYTKMLSLAKKYRADSVMCDILKTETKLSNHIKEGFYDKASMVEKVYPVMMFDFKRETPAVIPSLCNKIIKKELIEKVIFDVDEKIVFGEDALCTYPVMLDSERIYVLKDALYIYRENPESVTNIYDEKLLKRFVLLYREFKKQFDLRGVNLDEQLKGYIARFSLNCIKKELFLNKSVSLKKRLTRISNYINTVEIEESFKILTEKSINKNTLAKSKLIKQKHIFILFLTYIIKESFKKIKGRDYEKQSFSDKT